jgi:hypothetical protein
VFVVVFVVYRREAKLISGAYRAIDVHIMENLFGDSSILDELLMNDSYVVRDCWRSC